jgi:hypothetical protein
MSRLARAYDFRYRLNACACRQFLFTLIAVAKKRTLPMNIKTPIAVTVALLLFSGTLYAESITFRQDGPKKTTIITLKLNGDTVTGTFVFGDRVRDEPDAEPAGRAVSFTGTVKSRSRDGDISVEINFVGKTPLDRKENTFKIWHVKKTADGHRYLAIPLPPRRLQALLSSQAAL